MEIIALVPNVEPLFITMEPELVLVEVIEVNKTVRAVALGTPVVAIQFTAANALAFAFLFPNEFEGLVLGRHMRPVAPWLGFAQSASAPVVGLALLHFNLVATLFRNVR